MYQFQDTKPRILLVFACGKQKHVLMILTFSNSMMGSMNLLHSFILELNRFIITYPTWKAVHDIGLHQRIFTFADMCRSISWRCYREWKTLATKTTVFPLQRVTPGWDTVFRFLIFHEGNFILVLAWNIPPSTLKHIKNLKMVQKLCLYMLL